MTLRQTPEWLSYSAGQDPVAAYLSVVAGYRCISVLEEVTTEATWRDWSFWYWRPGDSNLTIFRLHSDRGLDGEWQPVTLLSQGPGYEVIPLGQPTDLARSPPLDQLLGQISPAFLSLQEFPKLAIRHDMFPPDEDSPYRDRLTVETTAGERATVSVSTGRLWFESFHRVFEPLPPCDGIPVGPPVPVVRSESSNAAPNAGPQEAPPPAPPPVFSR